MIMVFVIVYLANYGHLIIVGFLYNKRTLAILYRMVGTCEDREPLFVGANGQQQITWREILFVKADKPT